MGWRVFIYENRFTVASMMLYGKEMLRSLVFFELHVASWNTLYGIGKRRISRLAVKRNNACGWWRFLGNPLGGV
jgi:hypothetical protein